jgi:hypothetical protein
MATRIATDASPTDGPISVDLRRRLAEGVILWPRHFGLPQGPLENAFRVLSFARSALNAGVKPESDAEAADGPFDLHVLLLEGPHDPETYRVRYFANWQDPQKWGGQPGREEATHNYVTVELLAPWPANAETGPGLKQVQPTTGKFRHDLQGIRPAPTFRIVHVAG